MNYPVWSVSMGTGVLMALVAVLHVFVSHFAVGGGLWLVLTERAARRRDDAALLDLVRTNSRVFLLITLVYGAITGVGIWTTAALISPHGILALIHGYVWGWAMEWCFFVLEIAAALVYWYGWDRLDARTHQAVGWLYFVGAFMSLVIINGIVTFMLTPGRWPATHAFWDGFFNPTYWPSVVLRTGASLAQAGLFTLLVIATRPRGGSRRWATRWSAGWVAAGLLIAVSGTFWYDRALAAALPGWADLTAGAIPVLATVAPLLRIGLMAGLVVSLWPLLAPRTWNLAGAGLLCAAMLAVFFGGEWSREAARKPFVIQGYLYSTGLRAADADSVRAAGAGTVTRWRDPAAATPEARGRDLYRAWCLPCHTRHGYNGLVPYLAHWRRVRRGLPPAAQIAAFLPHLEYLRARMPPWYGNRDDTADLAAWLAVLGRDGDAAFPDDPGAAGALAFDLHCGRCHTLDGFRPLRDSLSGMTRDDLDETLDSLPDLAEEMPPFLGDTTWRSHLLDFLEKAAAPDVARGGTR